MFYIKEIINIGCKLIEKFEYNEKYHSYIFAYNNDIIIIDDDFHKDLENAFDYSIYCTVQNEYMKSANRLFRFVYRGNIELLIENVKNKLSSKVVEVVNTNAKTTHNHYDNTVAEKALEDRFVESFGAEALNFLHKEFEFGLSDGKNIYIDYYLETNNGNYALEANGVSYHHPCIVDEDYYDRLLEKQNNLVLFGLKIYRFSLENLQFKEQVIDKIKEYMGDKKDFIPKPIIKSKRGFTLYECQTDALGKIDRDRINGKTSSLIVLPTAAGKSEIFLSDIDKEYVKQNVRKILIMTPTVRVKADWEERVKNCEYKIDVLCYSSVFNIKNTLPQDYYDYILVDEAHHSQANNVKACIQYFKPKYLLGLTATDERLDNKKLEEIFGEYDVILSLKEAVLKGIVSNIRAYRLESNIDLKNIRFNGVDYNYSDLERNVIIDSRNELIADTLKKYFSPKDDFYNQGIVFCVNKNHCTKMAEVLNDRNIKACAVYGGNSDNDLIFEKYKNKEIQFLCSCQLLNEGWNCPQTSVIVMARPTLSKVMYQQQLGRGLRNCEGKECLYLIDVVDDYQAQLNPINYNSLFKIPMYRPFEGLVKTSFDPVTIFGLSEKEMALKEIDIFTFEEKFKDYLSLEKAARELYIGTNTLSKWNKNKKYASLYLPVGNKFVPYFSKEDILNIREDHPECINHTDDMLLSDFVSFIDENTLTFSFKLVFLLSSFSLANISGEINLDLLVDKYRNFYIDRINRGLMVDKKNCIYTLDYLNDIKAIKKNMLDNPFEKFERKRFFYYSKDLNLIAFNSILWKRLSKDKIKELKEKVYNFLKEYYIKYGGMDYEYEF